MSVQAELTTFRWLLLTVPNTDPSALTPQVFSTGYAPAHFTLAPVTPTGLATTGLLFMLKSPGFSGGSPATAGAGGFNVTPWIIDPGTKMVGSGATFPANYDELYSTFDFDASLIYFQIGNVSVGGSVFVGICEQ
jgi:hypothetical protein